MLADFIGGVYSLHRPDSLDSVGPLLEDARFVKHVEVAWDRVVGFKAELFCSF